MLPTLHITAHAIQRFIERNNIPMREKNKGAVETDVRKQITQEISGARKLTPRQITFLPLRKMGWKIRNVLVDYFLYENHLYVVKNGRNILTTWSLSAEELRILGEKNNEDEKNDFVVSTKLLQGMSEMGYPDDKASVLALIRNGTILTSHGCETLDIVPMSSTKRVVLVESSPNMQLAVEIDENNRVTAIEDLKLRYLPRTIEFLKEVTQKIFGAGGKVLPLKIIRAHLAQSLRETGEKIGSRAALRYGVTPSSPENRLIRCVIDGQLWILEFQDYIVVNASMAILPNAQITHASNDPKQNV